MRIDQFISQSLNISRSDAKKYLKQKRVTVDGAPCQNAGLKVDQNKQIAVDKIHQDWPQDIYILLNKPANYCCSHIDDGSPSALRLLPSYKKKLHFAGRLDADTTGLVLLSSDGDWCHRITSPKQKATKNKIYTVELAKPLSTENIQLLEQGILLNGEKNKTLPSSIQTIDSKHYQISICEGRYHQIKRMFAACQNHVKALHRSQIGPIKLDKDMQAGTFRHLSTDEINSF